METDAHRLRSASSTSLGRQTTAHRYTRGAAKRGKTCSLHTKQTHLWYFHNAPFYLFQPTAHAASDVFITAVHSFASSLDIYLRVGVEIGWKCSYWHLTAITFALKPSNESPWSLNERWAHPLCADCVQLTECDRDTFNPELILKSWYYYFFSYLVTWSGLDSFWPPSWQLIQEFIIGILTSVHCWLFYFAQLFHVCVIFFLLHLSASSLQCLCTHHSSIKHV